MTALVSAKAKIGKFFSRLGARDPAGEVTVDLERHVAQLIHPPIRLPATVVERRLAAALSGGPISLASLVERVSAGLYREELREGAGSLDLGLFGSRLFNRDVVKELHAANGILWEIKQKRSDAL